MEEEGGEEEVRGEDDYFLDLSDFGISHFQYRQWWRRSREVLEEESDVMISNVSQGF